MTKRIEGQDVFAPGFTNQAVQDILKLDTEVGKLLGQFQQLFTLSSQMAQAGGTANVSGINAITQSYTQANVAAGSRNQLLAEQAALEAKLNQLLAGEADEIIRLRKEIAQLTAQKRTNAQVTTDEIGAYQKSVNELHKLKRAIKDLYIAGKEQEAGTQSLVREYTKLNEAVRKAEQAVGEHQRNVGNYASGQKKYNYEMFQMTQILRELPNFAISSRIGIMSLSNNLPQLGDAFKRVREDGNSFTKTLGIFAKSIVSWQSLLLVAITAAVAFADEIGNLFTKQKQLSEAEEKRLEQIKQLNKEVDQLNKGYISEKIALEQLVAIASDENETKANRQKAIQAINDISPEYLGNLTEENITTQEGIALVNQYIALLEKRARVAGLMKRLENVEMKKYDLQQAEYAIKDMDTDRLKEILGEDQFERLSDLATFNGTLDLMSKNAIPAFQKLAREQIGKMYRIAEMEAISLLESIEGIDPAARIQASGGGKAKKEKTAKELKDTYIKDLISRLETQYQIEVNEEQKIHSMKMKAAKDNNLRLALEEKRHLKEMTDLKMKALKAEIDIMEARMPKLTQEEKDQLSVMKTNYDALAAQFAKDSFVLFDSGLKSTDSDKPSGSNVIGKRGPTSKESDKPKNKAKEMTRDLMDLAKAISDVMTKMEQAQQKQIDRQIDATKRKQETLRLLAAQGVKDAKDNLAFEEKEQAKLEQKQRQIERAALRRQAALAAMNTYAAKVQRGDTNALGGTISDLTALFAFASSIPGFHEGIENVSESDAIAKRNTTIDPFLAWLHPDERVLTAAENKMVGTMSNKELATLAYNYQNGLYVTSTTDATLNEMREIKNAIKNMQAPSWSWNDIEKAIEYKFQQGDKTIKEIHKTGGVWGGRH